MSAEAFDTVLSCDMRTAEDRRSVQVTRAGDGQPRWTDIHPSGERARAWASVHPQAETVVRIAADAVARQPMDGLTGDHPEKRELLAGVLHACADAIRELALDSACDGALATGDFEQALANIALALTGEDAPDERRAFRHRSVQVVDDRAPA